MRIDNLEWAVYKNTVTAISQARSLSKKASRWAHLDSESGVTALEYGLIAGLVAVVIVASVTALGTKLQGTFTTISGALP